MANLLLVLTYSKKCAACFVKIFNFFFIDLQFILAINFDYFMVAYLHFMEAYLSTDMPIMMCFSIVLIEECFPKYCLQSVILSRSKSQSQHENQVELATTLYLPTWSKHLQNRLCY